MPIEQPSKSLQDPDFIRKVENFKRAVVYIKERIMLKSIMTISTTDEEFYEQACTGIPNFEDTRWYDLWNFIHSTQKQYRHKDYPKNKIWHCKECQENAKEEEKKDYIPFQYHTLCRYGQKLEGVCRMCNKYIRHTYEATDCPNCVYKYGMGKPTKEESIEIACPFTKK